MNVYSYRFINVAGFLGHAAFEVPAGYVAVVRDIDACDFTPGGATIEAGIGDGAVFWIYTWPPETVGGWQGWRGRVVLQPGEQLVLNSSAELDMVASGYLLSLP